MYVLRLPCIVLRNVYVGLWVLVSELYWLFGPDVAFRCRQRARDRAIRRCRARLSADGDRLVRAELDVLEAEQLAASANQEARRARFLDTLRQRCGLAQGV